MQRQAKKIISNFHHSSLTGHTAAGNSIRKEAAFIRAARNRVVSMKWLTAAVGKRKWEVREERDEKGDINIAKCQLWIREGKRGSKYF